MTSTLYRDGRVRTPDHPAATALLVRDDAVAWTGDDPAAVADTADETVDLAGALVTPAFVDAHVHATSTGLALTGLDLSDATSLADCLRRVEAAGRAARGGIVLGHGWDETAWPEHRPPTRQELDRASYGGVVYLSRIDVHSAVVSSALLATVPEAQGQDGWSDSGHLTRDAHHVVRRVSRESITPAQRRTLQRATRQHAAGLGIGLLHELSGPDIAGADDLVAMLELAAAEPGPEVVGYWGEAAALGGVARARQLGALGAAGDLFADGSIGSHTASLLQPYADAAHSGHGYLDAAGVRDHVVACTEAGLQAGFHAIGDGALDAVLAGLAEAADRLGDEPVRAARHRIEHAEMAAPGAPAGAGPARCRGVGAARLRPAVGRRHRDVRRAARPAPGAVAQPLRGDGSRGHHPRPGLGLTGDPARPLGQRAGRRAAPDAGLGAEPGRCVRGAHPRRLAGRPARRRRGPHGRRAGDLRGLGRRRGRRLDRPAGAGAGHAAADAAGPPWCVVGRFTPSST